MPDNYDPFVFHEFFRLVGEWDSAMRRLAETSEASARAVNAWYQVYLAGMSDYLIPPQPVDCSVLPSIEPRPFIDYVPPGGLT